MQIFLSFEQQVLNFLCLTSVAESEELLAVKRLKLDYEDLVSVSADLQRRWEALLEAVIHGLIKYRHIDTKAKCRHLKIIHLFRGFAAGVYLSEAPSLPRFLFGVVEQFCRFTKFTKLG
jgi:hypothetical protein